MRLVDRRTVRRRVDIGPLVPERVAASFPLARLLAPELDLGLWRRFARAFAHGAPRHQRGILCAVGEGGHACGLAIYRVLHDDLRHGRVLSADHVIVLDIVDPRPVAVALANALEGLSEALGCAALRTGFDASQRSLRTLWQASGHRVEKTLLCKRPAGREPG